MAQLCFKSLENRLSGDLVNLSVPRNGDLGAAALLHLVSSTLPDQPPCDTTSLGCTLNPSLELNLPQPFTSLAQ
jgi:hypothetical protein